MSMLLRSGSVAAPLFPGRPLYYTTRGRGRKKRKEWGVTKRGGQTEGMGGSTKGGYGGSKNVSPQFDLLTFMVAKGEPYGSFGQLSSALSTLL